jgi:hypothetical protein
MADTATPESTGAAETPMDGGKRRSRWMAHVKKTMRANKGKSLSQVLKMAKKTYKKTRRGGADMEEEPMTAGGLSPLPLNGGRRRRGSRKSKKGSRKH